VDLQESERHLTVYVCPLCSWWEGDENADGVAQCNGWPLDAPHALVEMQRVEVVPRSEAEALAEALEEIADGYERHNPGWWIKRAKRALAAYRATHPRQETR
jgi:hypothetical protein